MKSCPICDTPYPDQHTNCPTDGAVLIETLELAPGQIVRGKYRTVRKLGQGGMGVVYLAEHLMLGGQLALKFLATELSRNPQFIKRFRQEARAAYQLRHPNIVEVVDLDQDEDGSLFIAMEYVAGPSLRATLHEAPHGLPVERALHIARGLGAGLAAAHARGAIHRDIKPENILLGTQPDGSEQPKVLDFGIAAMTEGITNLSRTHGLLLTPEYAAPEQWRGTPAAELDGRTDLYALGGVLYEMLTGRTPYSAVNMEGWMYQHLQGVSQPIERLRPELAREHPWLGAIVMRLLARDREQRFPSAAAFLEATAPQRLASRPATVVEKPTEPLPEEPTSTLKRSGSSLWVIAAILLAVCLGIWAAMWFSQSKTATAIPVLSPPGGTYAQARSVTISDATPNAVIHFTRDGSPPTETSPIYFFPISSLPTGAVVRAMATADGHTSSADITGVYIWSGTTQPAVNPPGPTPAATGPSVYDQGKSAYDRKDYTHARAHFSQACDGGELNACTYLGFLYYKGLGGQVDTGKAQVIYQKSCDGGHLRGCTGLGSLYVDAGDISNARKYFKKACNESQDADVKIEACDLLRGTQ
jgi:serine/threonine protein kinase